MYDSIAHYYRVVAAEASQKVMDGSMNEMDAVLWAFGTTEVHDMLNSDMDPTSDEIAVVRALVRCMVGHYS